MHSIQGMLIPVHPSPPLLSLPSPPHPSPPHLSPPSPPPSSPLLQLLTKVYGDFIVEPESGYDFSLVFVYDSLPEDKGEAWAGPRMVGCVLATVVCA